MDNAQILIPAAFAVLMLLGGALAYLLTRNRGAAKTARAIAVAGLVLGVVSVVSPPAYLLLAAPILAGFLVWLLPVPEARRGEKEQAPRVKPVSRTASEPAPDVFISYKREERPTVLAIASRLQALKLSVWFDAHMQSGTAFDAEINQAVRAAKCVLVCWSPGAVESVWVRSEADIGRTRGVLAAAMLATCDLMPPFNLIHTEDLRAGVSSHNAEWLKVLERIGRLVGRPGLAQYEAAQDRAALSAWIGAHPHDPLVDDAVARLRVMPA